MSGRFVLIAQRIRHIASAPRPDHNLPCPLSLAAPMWAFVPPLFPIRVLQGKCRLDDLPYMKQALISFLVCFVFTAFFAVVPMLSYSAPPQRVYSLRTANITALHSRLEA